MTKALRTYLKFIRAIIEIGVGIFLLLDCYSIISGKTDFFDVVSVILEIGMLLFLEIIYRYFMKGIIYIKIGEKDSQFVNLRGDEFKFDTVKVGRIINTTNWYKVYICEQDIWLRVYRIVIKVTVEKNGATQRNLCESDFPMAKME